jgi:hypothetical protein
VDVQVPAPDVKEDRKIIATMEGWLAGEPVWPLEDIWQEWGSEFKMYRMHWDVLTSHVALERHVCLYDLRDEWITRYGYAIPCAELIEALRAVAPIVEIGGGKTLYMAKLMRVNNIDVVSTDGRKGEIVLQGKTAVRRFPERTVFCSWPSLGETWFRQALKAMRIGQRGIFIIEDSCAEETARDYLDACFKLEQKIEIPAWPNMNDIALQYRKVRGCPC